MMMGPTKAATLTATSTPRHVKFALLLVAATLAAVAMRQHLNDTASSASTPTTSSMDNTTTLRRRLDVQELSAVKRKGLFDGRQNRHRVTTDANSTLDLVRNEDQDQEQVPLVRLWFRRLFDWLFRRRRQDPATPSPVSASPTLAPVLVVVPAPVPVPIPAPLPAPTVAAPTAPKAPAVAIAPVPVVAPVTAPQSAPMGTTPDPPKAAPVPMTPTAPTTPTATLAPVVVAIPTVPPFPPIPNSNTVAPIVPVATAAPVAVAPSPPAVCPALPSPPPLFGKKGIGFTLPNDGAENLPKVIRLRPYWNYSWGPRQVPNQPADIEFVPMIWGGNNALLVQKSLDDHVYPQIQRGQSKRLLGFNEPDSTSQSNVPFPRALDRWPLLESANVSLVSPSAVDSIGPWMKGFMANATVTCKRVDWIGVHWYGPASFNAFVSKLNATYRAYQRPILITEFAPADFTATTVAQNKISRAAVLNFMKLALPWLEKTAWIAGYAWYPYPITQPFGTSSALYNEAGELTAVGRFYTSIRTETPNGNQSITPDV